MAESQHPVELIMARGFASNLATPAFLVDGEGTLIFFNEAAGELLGLHFEDAGAMPAAEWGGRFAPTRDGGRALALDELPLAIALEQQRPAHAPMRIRAANGDVHDIEVTAFPIIGRTGSRGAIAIFWDDAGR